MNLGKTFKGAQRGDGSADSAATIVTARNAIMTSRGWNTFYTSHMFEWVVNIHCHQRAIHKHDPHTLNGVCVIKH